MSRDGTNQHFAEFDEVAASVVEFLNNYRKSEVLQQFGQTQLRALIYANCVANFFSNLTMSNVRALDLPRGQIGQLKTKYAHVMKTVRASLSGLGRAYTKDEYLTFRAQVEAENSDFLELLNRVELEFDLRAIEHNLKRWDADIARTGKTSEDSQSILTVALLEVLVQANGRFPHNYEVTRFFRRTVTPDLIKELAEQTEQVIAEQSKSILADRRLRQSEFESQLYRNWQKPLDLLEYMNSIAIESGEKKSGNFSELPVSSKAHQQSTLLQIHARAVQISNEILSLLKTGYADGAIARWRSLYELSVIAFLLYSESDEVSERFLAHDVMKSYKEAKEYRSVYKKLGYPPFGRKESAMLKKQHDNLIAKYGAAFEYRSGYEWIPPSVIFGPGSSDKARVTFRDIEQHVGLRAWRPFYSLSSNAVHSGPKGLFRLGLMYQDDVLLAGPSNYGLADPLQNTAISISQVMTCLLTLEPDLDDLLIAESMRIMSSQIGESAVAIQIDIEKEEERLRELEASEA